MSDVHQQRYVALKSKAADLDRRRAVLEERERSKLADREKIDAELKELGFDPNKAAEELARLEAEEKAKLDDAEAALNAYEIELNRVTTEAES